MCYMLLQLYGLWYECSWIRELAAPSQEVNRGEASMWRLVRLRCASPGTVCVHQECPPA